MHHALLEIVSVINKPERDEAILEIAGLSLERALFPLIVAIGRLGPIGVGDLAGRVGRDYTTVSRQVARLEELELVTRRASGSDRRIREAEITPKGKFVTNAVDAAREQMALALFKDWSRDDFDGLVRLLSKLSNAMTNSAAVVPNAAET
jgi:DNA-binding MarR family transcriptional regulator